MARPYLGAIESGPFGLGLQNLSRQLSVGISTWQGPDFRWQEAVYMGLSYFPLRGVGWPGRRPKQLRN